LQEKFEQQQQQEERQSTGRTAKQRSNSSDEIPGEDKPKPEAPPKAAANKPSE
jgi:hypothetical protein